jgi:hypothetical protein
LTLSRHRLSHCNDFSRLQFRHPVKQAVGAYFNGLADPCEGEDGTGNLSGFDEADRLPVDADQFGDAFLSETGLQPRRFHVRADDTEDLTVCHPLFETMPVPSLTSNMFDACLFATQAVRKRPSLMDDERQLTAAPSTEGARRAKKASPVRVLLLLCLLAVAGYACLNRTKGFSFNLSGKPSEANGRKVLEGRIEQQGKGVVSLVSFKKTNGSDRELLGQKFYEMEYEAEIEFSRLGSWLKGSAMMRCDSSLRRPSTGRDWQRR